MADVILVVLRRPEMAESVLQAADRLAILMGSARLNVLAVREPIHVAALAAEVLVQEAESIVRERERERQRVVMLHTTFERWRDETGSDARWTEAEVSAATIIGEHGSRADFIVAGQPSEEDRSARQALSVALFSTDRPVLLVAQGTIPRFGQCVAIAWRDDKRAVKAVIPALRCLASAERVYLLTGVRTGAPEPGVPRVILEHGFAAKLHVLPIGSEPFGRTLLDAAHRLSADLLVMGAYAHSPLRELIFGGVTRYVLDHADLPVLMRH